MPNQTGMFNVPQIQARLAGMSQQQLYQTGMANQNDALMFSLVNNENMNRQKAKQAMMAQQAGQQQPPVKQQDLMAMAPTPAPNMGSGIPLQGAGSPQQMAQNQLPEEQGIGALPAQNLQKMAGGGITGVASPEHHYAGNYPNLVSTNPNGPGGLQYYFDIPDSPSDRTVFKTLRGKLFGNEPVPAELNRLKGQFFKTPEEAQSALTQAQFDMSPSGIRKAAASSNVTNLLSQNQPTPEQETNNLNVPLYSQANNETAPASTPSAPYSAGIVAPQITGGGIAAGPRPTAAGSMKDAGTFYDKSKLEDLANTVVTETGVQNAQDRQALEDMLSKRPNIGGRAEARINAEIAKEDEDKEENKRMGLLTAGLAVLSGTSPYALQNLGQAKEGAKVYQEGLDKLKKAHDAHLQALDHIDDARDAALIGDQNLRLQSLQKAGDRMLDSRKFFVKAATDMTGMEAGIASNLYTNATNNYEATKRSNSENATRLAVANAQIKMEAEKLNMPPEQVRTALYIGNGNAEAGFNKMQELQRDKSGISLLTSLAGVNSKREAQGLPDMTLDEFLAGLPKAMAAMQTPKVVSGANPNAILTRPGMQ